MNFPQSTLEEINESERLLVVTAEERLGKHFRNARAGSVFLSRCIESVDHDRMNFGRFHALMKKHHMLAIMSAVRRHKVQAMMNLRQVLEAGAAAAFAIANPEDHYFFRVDQDNIVTSPKGLTEKRYQWLEGNFKAGSDAIKAKKKLINAWQAHANVVSADSVFKIAEAGDVIDAPFFDREDDYFVKSDLWLASAIALDLMDLFYGVNKGRNVVGFINNFPDYLEKFARDTEALRAEVMATDRFKSAAAKAGAAKA
jgi:hypothetical protein